MNNAQINSQGISRPLIIFGDVEFPVVKSFTLAYAKNSPIIFVNLSTKNLVLNEKWNSFNHANLVIIDWKYPPGFNGIFGSLFEKKIKSDIKDLINRISKQYSVSPWLLISYPKFTRYISDIENINLIYYNYDDLSEVKKNEIKFLQEEQILVSKAIKILCSSFLQAEEFKNRFPFRLNDIHHFHHGIDDSFIADSGDVKKNMTSIAVVGGIGYRYDWELIYKVIKALPDFEFVFIGNVNMSSSKLLAKSGWKSLLIKVLSMPNVTYIDTSDELQSARYVAQSFISWMPYKVDLRFNQHCCPLKLFTGIASGHPVLSSDIAEAKIFEEWVSIYENSEMAIELIKKLYSQRHSFQSLEKRSQQINFAREITWGSRVRVFIRINSA
jgi:hypothetical protein